MGRASHPSALPTAGACGALARERRGVGWGFLRSKYNNQNSLSTTAKIVTARKGRGFAAIYSTAERFDSQATKKPPEQEAFHIQFICMN